MKKANIILLLILCLAVAGAIFFVFRLEKTNAPEPEATAAPTATPSPTATPAPTDTPAPIATPAPAVTSAPTTAPTDAPVITPAPASTGTPEPAHEREGTFRSDTGAWLNLVVNWKLVEDGEKMTLHMEAFAEAYSLICSGADDVEFIVGGTSVKDSSGVINNTSNDFTQTKIGTADIEVERGKTVDVFVTWKYKGQYGSPSGTVKLDTIEANTEIYIP